MEIVLEEVEKEKEKDKETKNDNNNQNDNDDDDDDADDDDNNNEDQDLSNSNSTQKDNVEKIVEMDIVLDDDYTNRDAKVAIIVPFREQKGESVRQEQLNQLGVAKMARVKEHGLNRWRNRGGVRGGCD